MNDETYLAEILAAYEGELGGEITSAALIDLLRVSDARKVKLDLLRRLEARVGSALAPIVARLGAAPADRAGLASRARDRALAVESWEDLIDQFGPRLDPYVARFEALHAVARAGDAAALVLLVAHERALIAFGRLERAGDEAGALACLQAAVGYTTVPSMLSNRASRRVPTRLDDW